MTERPIIFSAPMVRAILDGRKTQTRRAIKPVPTINGVGAIFDEGDRQEDFVEPYWVFPETCKYGKPGDLLWVRETWAPLADCVVLNCAYYRLDHEEARSSGSRVDVKWRPSIYMPRWASRITLRITDIRVERLQDISEEDAKAEGVKPLDYAAHHVAAGCGARIAFEQIWTTINGPAAWEANPWVWVISFERVKP